MSNAPEFPMQNLAILAIANWPVTSASINTHSRDRTAMDRRYWLSQANIVHRPSTIGKQGKY